MKIKCPSCNVVFDAPDTYIGKNIKCPECQESFEATGNVIVKALEVIPESVAYKAIDDFPEIKIATTFCSLGKLIIGIGGIALVLGFFAGGGENTIIFIFSGIAAMLSSIWFFGASALICAISRNTLEVHLFRKQQNKTIEK